VTSLPELQSGDRIRTKTGEVFTVHRLTRRQAAKERHAFDEPLYRLERIVLGKGIYTLQDLQQADCEVVK